MRGWGLGCTDGWEDDGEVFRYFGERQRGDMEFIRGNTAVRDHAVNGKALHVFVGHGDGLATYMGEMTHADAVLEDGAPDADGNRRRAIVFRLAP